MPYQIKTLKVPDSLKKFEETFTGLQEELDYVGNPQVMYIPKFDRLLIISETHFPKAPEAAKAKAREFLKQRLEFIPEEKVYTDDVLQEYFFDIKEDRLDPRWLGRLVFEVFPHVKKRQIRCRGKRANIYQGLSFKVRDEDE